MRPRLLPVLGTLMLISACGGDAPTAEDKPALIIGNGDSTSTAVLHQMPTPNELFVQVRALDGVGEKRLLSPASQADRYASLKSRAVNFGIYSTDLVYASTFKLNVEVVRYYLATKKLAESLGLSAVFTDAEFVRLEANLTRGDSLELISNEVYLRAYGRLQADDMGPVLSMVLIGGWVESMHLITQQGGNGVDRTKVMARVGEQKSTLEHLVALTETQAGDADVAALRNELLALLDIYDQLNVRRTAHSGKSSSGRMVLGEDIKVDITEEKYKDLQQAIERLRAELTRPEDQTNASAQ